MLKVRTINNQGISLGENQINLPKNFIERGQARFLAERLYRAKTVELIQGPSFSGKTTIMFALMSMLASRFQVKPDRMIYIPCEWAKETKVFDDPLLFLENMRSVMSLEEPCYLFFDDVEHIEKAKNFIETLRKLNTHLRIVLSSSLRMADVSHFRVTHLYPISMVEWVGFHDGVVISEVRKQIYSDLEKGDVLSLKMMDQKYKELFKEKFYELALFGAYPDVLLAKREDRWFVLDKIYESYFKTDKLKGFGVDKPELLKQLHKVLSNQVHELINYSELSDLLKASHITIKKYQSHLAKHYLLENILPLTGKKSGEIKQAQKTFFCDTGLLNLASDQKGNHIFKISSKAITNMLLAEIIKNLNYKNQVHFWQTNTGTSVDFVVASGNKYFVPITVKFGEARPKKLKRSLHSFIKTYKPKRALLVNESLIDYYKVGETEVLYLPYYWVPVLEGVWQ